MKRLFQIILFLFFGFILINFAFGSSESCPPNHVCIPPPTTATSFEELISNILKFLRNVSLVVGPIIIVVAGYFFVTAMGDPAKVTQAKKIILYTSIGILIIMLAEGIVGVIKSVFETRK